MLIINRRTINGPLKCPCVCIPFKLHGRWFVIGRLTRDIRSILDYSTGISIWTDRFMPENINAIATRYLPQLEVMQVINKKPIEKLFDENVMRVKYNESAI